MALSAGDFNRRISIMAQSPGVDELGQPSGAWDVLVCEVWASYRAPTGMGSIAAERVVAGQEISSSMCSWRIRWRTGITTEMQVHETTDGVATVWDIKQVLMDRAKRQHVDLVCETSTPGAV